MKLKFTVFIACLAFCMAQIAAAEIVVLKNGTRYRTDNVVPVAGAYYFKADGRLMNVAIGDVATIEHETRPAPVAEDAVSTAVAAAPALPAEEAELAFIAQCRQKMEADAAKRKSDYEQTCARALAMVEGLYTGSPPPVEMFDYYFNILEGKSFWMYLTAGEGEKLKAILYREDGPLDKQYIELAEERADLAERTARAREALAKGPTTPQPAQTPYNPYLTNPYLIYPNAMYPYGSAYPYGYVAPYGYPFSAWAGPYGNAYLGLGYSTFSPTYSTFYPSSFGNDYGNYGSSRYRYNNDNRNYRYDSSSRSVRRNASQVNRSRTRSGSRSRR